MFNEVVDDIRGWRRSIAGFICLDVGSGLDGYPIFYGTVPEIHFVTPIKLIVLGVSWLAETMPLECWIDVDVLNLLIIEALRSPLDCCIHERDLPVASDVSQFLSRKSTPRLIRVGAYVLVR